MNGSGNYGLKSERGQDGRKSPGANWGVKQEGGPKSPGYGSNNWHGQQDESMRDEYQSRGRGRGGPASGGNCFKCDQPGHWARECPNEDTSNFRGRGRGRGRGRDRDGGGDFDDMDRGAYKRPRREDESGTTNGNWGGGADQNGWNQTGNQTGGWDGA